MTRHRYIPPGAAATIERGHDRRLAMVLQALLNQGRQHDNRAVIAMSFQTAAETQGTVLLVFWDTDELRHDRGKVTSAAMAHPSANVVVRTADSMDPGLSDRPPGQVFLTSRTQRMLLVHARSVLRAAHGMARQAAQGAAGDARRATPAPPPIEVPIAQQERFCGACHEWETNWSGRTPNGLAQPGTCDGEDRAATDPACERFRPGSWVRD